MSIFFFLGFWVLSTIIALPLSSAGTDTDLPPIPPSPVEEFRQWLEMAPDQREKELASWPEPNRAILRRKLDFYETLPGHERERRLQMLDLRWYLAPLLSRPATNRAEQLKLVPERYRAIVQKRIEQWDRLPANLQREMLENELALQYFARLRGASKPGEKLDPKTREELEQKTRAWQMVPREEREELSRRLAEFFELPAKQREKTLQSLSETERQEIEASLNLLSQLSPAQRQACIQSFDRLSKMSPEEQILFLSNAARWQAMTPEERQTWKQLVTALPPLPPELELPPLPPEPSSENSEKEPPATP